MWSDSPGWRRGSGWMWVDGQNFVGMTDRQMAEWRGGSVYMGMTDGWMDGWQNRLQLQGGWRRKNGWMWVDVRGLMDGVRWGTW